MEKLGERIKFYRNKSGLTQNELAEKLKISYPTLNKYEKGHRIPDAYLICRIAEILHCDPGFLLTGNQTISSNYDENLTEIIKLLLDHPEDKVIILKLLNARKIIRETYIELGISNFSFIKP